MDLLVLVDRVMVEACLVVDILSWLEVILFVYFCKQLHIGFAWQMQCMSRPSLDIFLHVYAHNDHMDLQLVCLRCVCVVCGKWFVRLLFKITKLKSRIVHISLGESSCPTFGLVSWMLLSVILYFALLVGSLRGQRYRGRRRYSNHPLDCECQRIEIVFQSPFSICPIGSQCLLDRGRGYYV